MIFLFLFFSIWFAFFTWVLAIALHQDWQLLSGPSRRTMGRVVGHRKTENEGTSYWAIVEFTDWQGKVHVIDDWQGSETPIPPAGGTLEVEYSEASPHKGRVRRPMARSFVYCIILSFLALPLVIALAWIKG